MMTHSITIPGHPKTVLTLKDLDVGTIQRLLETAAAFKACPDAIPQSKRGQVLVLYFEKRSTRTRLSCTAAWSKLGGTVIDMSPMDGKSHIGVNESVYDSFRVMADMADCIVARVYEHSIFTTICRAVGDSRKKPPVINGLSDQFHPLQVLADVLTMHEVMMVTPRRKDTTSSGASSSSSSPSPSLDAQALQGKVVAWVGDGNNVCASLAMTLPRLGMEMRVASPPGYTLRAEAASDVTLCTNPADALRNADFVVTDTWVSMGDEKDKKQRVQAFQGYQLNANLLASSQLPPHWTLLHCLPRKPDEVTDDVFYGPHSQVWREAENRLWTTLAVFAMC